MSKSSIAVTGATGQLGRLVVESLIERGVAAGRIVAAVRSPEKAAGLASGGVQVREVVYRDVPAEAYAEALVGFGLPEPFARVLADSDLGIRRGELFTDSADLRELIGRPTTTLAAAVAGALKN